MILRLVILALLFLLFGYLGHEATRIDGPAGVYPLFVLGALVLLLVLISVQELRLRGAVQTDAELATLGDRRSLLGLVLFVGVWFAYAGLLNTLGFLGATTLAVASSLRLLGGTSFPRAIGAGVVFALTMAVLFKTVLYVPVPLAAPDLALEQLLYLARKGN